jgi:nucleoside-diphosphate-sugar epimerase
MKIIVTGSLGHISKPLADSLLQKGHSVVIVGNVPYKQTDIEVLGTKAAIDSIEGVDFLTATFA